MRPQAGVGKLKHAPPMQANDLPLVAQAIAPANRIFSQHLTVAAPMWFRQSEPTSILFAVARHHRVGSRDHGLIACFVDGRHRE
jgi:hypothetical protein